MLPKAVRVKALTRSQTEEQDIEFMWSRQLGGSVEVTTREIDDEDPAGIQDEPAGEGQGSVSVEIEVEESSEGESVEYEEEVEGLELQEQAQGRPTQPVEDHDAVLRRHSIPSIAF